MSELAGFGIPAWLPPQVQRAIAQENAREQLESKRAQVARAERAEDLHQRAMALYKEQAEQRGQEVVDVMDLAAGRVRGRTVQHVLAAALAASARDDKRVDKQTAVHGTGQPELLHVEFGEPVIHTAARSERGRAMSNRLRHWQDRRAARQASERAELEAIRSRDDYGLVDGAKYR